LRGVAQAADPVVATATAYLAHGAGQHFWQNFLVALEQQSVTPNDEAEIIDVAGLAFSMFAQAAARV
jgi:heme oxygenase (biliverdin-IX-beta and delta-forming)